MERPSVVRSNRKVLDQAQSWLRPSGGPQTRARSKPNNSTAAKPDLAEQILHDRLAARQVQGLERAKQAGERRKHNALEKVSASSRPGGGLSHNSTKPSNKPAVPARRKSSSGRSTARFAVDESLKLAMALQREEWEAPIAAPSCSSTERARREALLGVVDDRLAQSNRPEEAYASELQRMDDEQATRELIAQLAREDQVEAQGRARTEMHRQQRAAQQQQEQQQQAMMASMVGGQPAGSQIDMSYESLIQLSPVEVRGCPH